MYSAGDIVLLSDVVDNRKDYEPKTVINEQEETVWDVMYTSLGSDLLVGILCHSESKDGIYLTWWVIGDKERQITPQKLHIKREERQLQGYLLHSNKNESVQLITLCKCFCAAAVFANLIRVNIFTIFYFQSM